MTLDRMWVEVDMSSVVGLDESLSVRASSLKFIVSELFVDCPVG